MKNNSQLKKGDGLSLPKGWELKKIPKTSEDFERKRVPITKSKRVAGNVPYYGASGIVDYVEGFLFDEDLLLVSEDGVNLLARTYPIAFSISGKTWVNNHAHILKFEDINTQKYVEFYLNSIKLDDFISGMAQPKLNQTKLNLITIPIPNSITEQINIVDKVRDLQTETKKLEAIYHQKTNDLEQLKKSLLKRIFNRELSMVNDELTTTIYN